MGCGKTTHGKKLAKALGYHFIDLDHYISHQYEKTLTDLFKEVGEPEFRKIETDALTECLQHHVKTVIALGGGTPCFNNNLEIIKANGILVYIRMEAVSLYHRLFHSKSKRPLVTDKADEELLQYIEQLLGTREPIYRQAHVVVNGLNLNEMDLKQAIMNYVNNN